MPYELIIVGGGLAGATAAYALAKRYDTLLIHHQTGASGIDLGLAHPLMGKKANPVYRIDEAIESLKGLLQTLDIQGANTPIFRPVTEAMQIPFFQKNATRNPHLGQFFEESPIPNVLAPMGGILMPEAFALSLPEYLIKLTNKVNTLQAEVRAFGENNQNAWVDLANGERLFAHKILLCLGGNFIRFSPLKGLNLHQVLGQVLSFAAPFDLNVALSGSGYVAQHKKRWHVGSTYQHQFAETAPTMEQAKIILNKISLLFDKPLTIHNLEMQSGIRVTVPKSILPVISKVPDFEQIWLYSGLGTKGILMSALLHKYLEGFLFGNLPIPPELQFRT